MGFYTQVVFPRLCDLLLNRPLVAHRTRLGQFLLHQGFKLLGFDAVAANPVPETRPDVSEERPPARQGNGLEPDPLPSLADLLRVAPYTSLQTMLDAAWAPGFQNYWRAEYLRELPDAAADVLLDALHSITSPLSDFKVFTLGGAIARVPEEATAYSHREAPLVVNINARWSDGADSGRHTAWTRSLWDAMQPFSAGGGYTNWMGNEGPDRIRAAYGERKFERLVALKTRYDPTNFLRLNQNIPPSMLLRRERQYL